MFLRYMRYQIGSWHNKMFLSKRNISGIAWKLPVFGCAIPKKIENSSNLGGSVKKMRRASANILDFKIRKKGCITGKICQLVNIGRTNLGTQSWGTNFPTWTFSAIVRNVPLFLMLLLGTSLSTKSLYIVGSTW